MTSKPLSSISYNSESFLVERIESLVKAHIVQFGMYIKHVGEDGDKDHYHIFLMPNKSLDPMDIKEGFAEFDPSHPDKPLGCLNFRPSKYEDWLMYAIHDPSYLRCHGGDDGKLEYHDSDVHMVGDENLSALFIRARASVAKSGANIAKRLYQDCDNAIDLVFEGYQVQNVFAVKRLIESGKSISSVEKERDTYHEQLRKLIDFVQRRFEGVLYIDPDTDNWEFEADIPYDE